MLISSPITKATTAFLALLAAIAGFIALAQWQQHNRQMELTELRASAPRAWLDDLRWREGFGSYLAALRDLRHFDQWQAEAPLFLIGRWAEEPTGRQGLRAALETHCLAGYVFEDGRLRRFGRGAFSAPARYRIDDGGHILASTDSGRWRLAPDPNGPALHHLRLTTPDGATADLVRCD